MEPKVEARLEFDAVRIYINDTLHVHIKRSDLLGVQSWQWQNNYCIEYTMRGGTMLTEYTDIKTWLTILQQLAKLPLA